MDVRDLFDEYKEMHKNGDIDDRQKKEDLAIRMTKTILGKQVEWMAEDDPDKKLRQEKEIEDLSYCVTALNK